jgi:C4-dicarboxylate-specific signal transduction histidine kinase
VEPTYQLFAERVHPEDMPIVQDILQKAIRDGKDFHFDYRIILPDGSMKHLQSVGRHIGKESGRSDDYIGTTMDITDRKRSEEELRQSEASLRKAQSELAHVTRVTTMGELAASIAHEVNQPIAGVVINGTTCLRLLSRVKEDSGIVTQVREALQRIIRDGTRAGEVLARIRSLFKKAESAKEPLDMNEAIREVIILTRNEMEKHRIALRLELAAGLPWVIGDRVQLQQVMLNLILNAIEAMSNVADRTRDLVIATQITEKKEVHVMVRDSGVGLDPLSAEQVFTAFHTTKPGGLGMGLSISRSIVEHHGGRLWATANAGPGATFQFTLSTHPHENPARTRP